jgi:hypothetical protein
MERMLAALEPVQPEEVFNAIFEVGEVNEVSLETILAGRVSNAHG